MYRTISIMCGVIVASGAMTAHATVAESPAIQVQYADATMPYRLNTSADQEMATDQSQTSLAMLQDSVDVWGPNAGDWEFIITGGGTSDRRFESTQFSTTFSIGYFLTDDLEVSLRQSIEFFEADGTNFAGATRGALDYHFDLDRWRPFLGGSFGGIYGDGIDETFFAGLEGGVKWYVRPDTFIFGMVEYQWFFDDIGTADGTFSSGRWVYSIGIGLNF